MIHLIRKSPRKWNSIFWYLCWACIL